MDYTKWDTYYNRFFVPFHGESSGTSHYRVGSPQDVSFEHASAGRAGSSTSADYFASYGGQQPFPFDTQDATGGWDPTKSNLPQRDPTDDIDDGALGQDDFTDKVSDLISMFSLSLSLSLSQALSG